MLIRLRNAVVGEVTAINLLDDVASASRISNLGELELVIGDPVRQRTKALGMIASWPPVLEAATGSGAPSAGALEAVGVYLYAGQVITSIGFCVVTSGASLTGGFTAIYDSNYNLVAQSASNVAPFQAAAGWQSLALSAPYTVPADGLYYLAHMQVGTTPAVMPRCAAQGAMSTPGLPSGKYPWFFQGGLSVLPNPAVPASSGNGYLTTCF